MMAAPAVAAMTASAAPGALAAPAPYSMAAPQGAAFAATPAAAQLPSKPQMVTLIPNNGQTPDQQSRDRYDCYRFALSQSGYDPLHPNASASPDQQSAYERARRIAIAAIATKPVTITAATSAASTMSTPHQ